MSSSLAACVVACASAHTQSSAHVAGAKAADAGGAKLAGDAGVGAPVRPSPAALAARDNAIGRGRTATVAKRYAEAVAAFDEALVAVPHDARALSERGYARLLSGDIDHARIDFEAAVNSVPKSDKQLAAQIYFNIGLVAEKQHNTDAAAVAFRTSYEYNPTNAAKSKMTTSCPAEVRDFTVAQARNAPGLDDTDDTMVDRTDSGAYIIGSLGDVSVILPLGNGGFATVGTSAKTMQYRASFVRIKVALKDRVDVSKVDGQWRIEVQPIVDGRSTCMVPLRTGPDCEVKDGETAPFDCNALGVKDDDGVDCANGGGYAPSLNVESAPGGTQERYFVDAKTGTPLWLVRVDTKFADALHTDVTQGALHVTGAGCDITKKAPQK